MNNILKNLIREKDEYSKQIEKLIREKDEYSKQIEELDKKLEGINNSLTKIDISKIKSKIEETKETMQHHLTPDQLRVIDNLADIFVTYKSNIIQRDPKSFPELSWERDFILIVLTSGYIESNRDISIKDFIKTEIFKMFDKDTFYSSDQNDRNILIQALRHTIGRQVVPRDELNLMLEQEPVEAQSAEGGKRSRRKRRKISKKKKIKTRISKKKKIKTRIKKTTRKRVETHKR